ncbi:MAG: N-acetylmuramoyl-L-alanine amidase [Candidatus Aminicenantes bacterium]|nr:MAG: N-acetylmuramoyl-L-alanine amidase [Candidatus Aminicenantes bacterium]
MKFLFAERKKVKMKSTILKGVFEDNLRMMGKAENPGNNKKQLKKKNLVKIGGAFFLVILIYVFFNHFDFLNHTFFKNLRSAFIKSEVTRPSQDSEPKFNETETSHITPSEYNAFLIKLPMPLRKIFNLKVKLILIDPGHGGEDPGTRGRLGTEEKDITLDIAMKLRDRLKKYPGYQILMTREKDITLSLNHRIDIAKSCGADLFISIHINYIPDKPINTIETYYFGPHTDKASLVLAEKENKGTEYTLNDFKGIIRNIENTLKTQESRSLAYFMQKSLYSNIRRENKDIKNFGIKTAPFVVLLGVDIPSVLTEVTCLSNINEEMKLNTENYRKEIARYLEEGIVNYLNKK